MTTTTTTTTTLRAALARLITDATREAIAQGCPVDDMDDTIEDVRTGRATSRHYALGGDAERALCAVVRRYGRRAAADAMRAAY